MRTAIAKLNTSMRWQEIIEGTPTKAYCRNTPKHKMSASWLASCKSQGHVARDGKKSHKVGKKRITVGGRKLKGQKYDKSRGLPDYS